jgi:hypothetical protein
MCIVRINTRILTLLPLSSRSFALPTDGCRVRLQVLTRAHNKTLAVKVMKAMLPVTLQ